MYWILLHAEVIHPSFVSSSWRRVRNNVVTRTHAPQFHFSHYPLSCNDCLKCAVWSFLCVTRYVTKAWMTISKAWNAFLQAHEVFVVKSTEEPTPRYTCNTWSIFAIRSFYYMAVYMKRCHFMISTILLYVHVTMATHVG